MHHVPNRSCNSPSHEHCSAKTVFIRITFRQDAFLQFTFQKKILCRALNRLPLGRCNKIAAPSNRIPHTAHQEVVALEGELQEAFIGKKLLIKKLSLGENCYLCWQSSHLRRWI